MKPFKTNCNPPCLHNLCACGFNDDDPRFEATRPTTTNVQPKPVEQLPVYPGTTKEGEVLEGGKVVESSWEKEGGIN